MATGNKRRKLEHIHVEERTDEDASSFASFSSDEQDGGQDGVELDALGDVDNGGDKEAAENLEDDDNDEGSDEEEYTASKENDDAPDKILQNRSTQQSAASKEQAHRKRQSLQQASQGLGGGSYSANTFKSNMFKLQVDDLLEQLRPRQAKREEAVEHALRALKHTIEQTPARQPMSVDEAERGLLTSSKVAIPFPQPRPPPDAKYKLEYAKPSNVNVVGSFASKNYSRRDDILEVDMTVTMPSSLFQEKDYLNYRYFYKRAYYLACIAAALKKSHSKTYNFQFAESHADPLKPVLIVTPSLESSTFEGQKPVPKWRITVNPCISAELLPSNKLTPDKNCVRPSEGMKAEATPFYNSSLRSDMLTAHYLKLLRSAGTTCAAFGDACMLGRTWLRQRGFASSITGGGFGNFEWTALMALLLQGGGTGGRPLLSEGYSCYQLFKATLQVLAARDMTKQALIVGKGEVKPMVDGSPIVWDSAAQHNLLYKVTPWAIEQLRREAKTTLAMLSDSSFDGFDATFILRVDNTLLRYDYVAELPARSVIDSKAEVLHNTCPQHQKLYETLKRGLVDRVTQISILPPPSTTWHLGSSLRKGPSDANVRIGLVVNPDTVNRTVDHGPPAEARAETAAFRKFWGEKAELRRFKDGSILESLIWQSEDAGKDVLEQIIRFLLSMHFGEAAERELVFIGDGTKRLLRQDTGTAVFRPIMESFKQLEADIRSLEDLPLSVRQVMPADPQLRYSSLVHTASSQRRHPPRPADVTIQFEGSAKWPDDLVAIQRTKIAFLLKLGERLQETVSGLSARVGLENQDQDVLNQGFLDILYDSGPAFRMRIYHDREQTLLERQLKDRSLAPSARDAAVVGLAEHRRRYLRTPAHTQAIARLCSRHSALSGSIRLMKKWFASHLLSNHFEDEVIELIVVRTFVQPWPWQSPSSVQTGFLRTMHWLSRWDWRAEPLIVDLSDSGELSQADRHTARATFEAWRKLDPSLNRIALFAASNVDLDGTTWTSGRPAKVVAGRMTALAKAACAEIEGKQSQLEPAALFSSPLSDYDVVLHLDPKPYGKNVRKGLANGTVYKNLEITAFEDDSFAGFDPARSLLIELEHLYGSAMLLFFGASERPIIAGLWSPQTATRAWKVNLAYSTIPGKATSTDDIQAEINKQALVAEIAKLGGDLIESIEVK